MERSGGYLVIGSSGQDGILTEKLLSGKNLRFMKINRDGLYFNEDLVLPYLQISAKTLSTEMNRNKIDKVFFLAGFSQSSQNAPKVETSIEIEAHQKVEKLLLTVLDAIEYSEKRASLFYTSSMLIYSRDFDGIVDEKTTPNPSSYYGEHKMNCANLIETRNRNSHLCDASIGIMFNHESCYRDSSYFSAKVILAALRYKSKMSLEKSLTPVFLGSRDFGYAPQYMDLAYNLLTNSISGNFLFSTGTLVSVIDFVTFTCSQLDIDPKTVFKIVEGAPEVRVGHQFTADNKKLCNQTNIKPNEIVSSKLLVENLVNDWQAKL